MKTRNTFLIVTGAALVLLLGACQRGGVSSDDAAAIRQQLEDVANRLDVVEDRIDDLATDATGNEMLVSQVRNELNQARNTLAEVDEVLAAETAADTVTDDGLTDEGFGDEAPLEGFGQDAGDTLQDFGDDVNDAAGDVADDLNDTFDDATDDGFGAPTTPGGGLGNDGVNDGDGNDDLNAPAAPGPGGTGNDTVPGLPADGGAGL